MIAPWAAVVVGLATLVWLLLFTVALLRPAAAESFSGGERALVVATVALAVIWVLLAPPWSLGSVGGDAPRGVAGCTSVREGMPATEVSRALAGKPRIVSEEDSRGPGAAAWVYDGERCIVRLIDGRVSSVEEERIAK